MAVLYTLIILIYILFELPTIQLFAVHHKKAEADFIKKYHLVMFGLCVGCIALQIYAHSTPDRPHVGGGGGSSSALSSKNSFIAGARRQPTQVNLFDGMQAPAASSPALHAPPPETSTQHQHQPTSAQLPVLRRSMSSGTGLVAAARPRHDPTQRF